MDTDDLAALWLVTGARRSAPLTALAELNVSSAVASFGAQAMRPPAVAASAAARGGSARVGGAARVDTSRRLPAALRARRVDDSNYASSASAASVARARADGADECLPVPHGFRRLADDAELAPPSARSRTPSPPLQDISSSVNNKKRPSTATTSGSSKRRKAAADAAATIAQAVAASDAASKKAKKKKKKKKKSAVAPVVVKKKPAAATTREREVAAASSEAAVAAALAKERRRAAAEHKATTTTVAAAPPPPPPLPPLTVNKKRTRAAAATTTISLRVPAAPTAAPAPPAPPAGRKARSLGLLVERLFGYLRALPVPSAVRADAVCAALGVKRRRFYDVANFFEVFGVITSDDAERGLYVWHGDAPLTATISASRAAVAEYCAAQASFGASGDGGDGGGGGGGGRSSRRQSRAQQLLQQPPPWRVPAASDAKQGIEMARAMLALFLSLPAGARITLDDAVDRLFDAAADDAVSTPGAAAAGQFVRRAAAVAADAATAAVTASDARQSRIRRLYDVMNAFVAFGLVRKCADKQYAWL